MLLIFFYLIYFAAWYVTVVKSVASSGLTTQFTKCDKYISYENNSLNFIYLYFIQRLKLYSALVQTNSAVFI